MIFVTVGAQMPFDRLVHTVDDWAGSSPKRVDVFAQIGPTARSPRHLRWQHFVPPPEFERIVLASDLIVAHAGMGTIITALELGKPILVMPRRGDLRETRNDHQLATVARFAQKHGVHVANDEVDLADKLSRLAQQGAPTADPAGGIGVSAQLLQAIRDFVGSPKAS